MSRAGCGPARCRPGCSASDDRGEHWQQVSALWNVPEREKWFGGGYDDAGIHSISPDPRDAKPRGRRASPAAACGISTDAGESWTLRGDGLVAAYMPPELAGQKETQDPHRVARCAAAPDMMWMQHHCGIFRSTDAGVTWTQLKLPVDDFGFAVAAHPKDPLTAWFVPAIKDELRVPRDGALAVTRTRDGGKTWRESPRRPAAARRLRPDLPPRPRRRCNRHAARHGLDHRQPVGERECRRGLAAGQRPSAADLCGAAVLAAD